jgi:hypothetical protein
MNRRTFLKSLSALPFVGGLFARAESKPDIARITAISSDEGINIDLYDAALMAKYKPMRHYFYGGEVFSPPSKLSGPQFKHIRDEIDEKYKKAVQSIKWFRTT